MIYSGSNPLSSKPVIPSYNPDEDVPDYSYTPVSDTTADPLGRAVHAYGKDANDTNGVGAVYKTGQEDDPTTYRARLNAGVSDNSNLMGPRNDNDPEDSALSARARQIYDSNVNQVYRRTAPEAEGALASMQQKDIAHQAAVYSNQQSLAQINYNQAAFQRAAAVAKETQQRLLYQQLFGGFAQVAGMGAGAAMGGFGNSGGGGNDPSGESTWGGGGYSDALPFTGEPGPGGGDPLAGLNIP